MSSKLALHGGNPVIRNEFKLYQSYGPEEVEAARKVVESGTLSSFIGAWDPCFYGGPRVQEFEREWAKAFEVPHAVTVNSATSGLIAAVGAVGVEPGDEVIVSTFTMAASATAIMVWDAIPVFADIEPETFGLDPKDIERKITPRTRAIVVSDIFGHGARLKEIMAIARRHGLKVIEDAAQAPYAKYQGKFVGTISDIGIFSLNYHKHIHTGEGGVCVTHSAELAERLQLIRNHGEAVVEGKKTQDISNILGFNFRLGEVEAGMGIEQLKKLPRLARSRGAIGDKLTSALKELAGLQVPKVEAGCTHVYYLYPLVIEHGLGVDRNALVAALEAEGLPAVFSGYQNIHRLPMYRQKILYGRKGHPWTLRPDREFSYGVGTLPVAEELYDKSLIALPTCKYEFSDQEVESVIQVFRKVWNHLESLRA